jgi:RAT1-interacting protein
MCSYIEEEIDFASRRPSNRVHALAMFAGYKFEEISTLEKTWDESTRDEIERRNENVVDNIQQYCSVVKTQLGSSTLIIGGEVDCLWGISLPRLRLANCLDYKPEPPGNPVTHYLELKTTRELVTPRQIETFETQKLLKFWAQSFLLGVPRIIVGFRSQHNTLSSIVMLETVKIPGQVSNSGENVWDGTVCINFVAKFLEFLKKTITEDGVFGIRFVKGGDTIEVSPKEGESFLTPEYIKFKSQ